MSKPGLLIVDDEVDAVDALERLFRKKFKVHKATAGKDALQILQEHPVHIIISDQRMPEMLGTDFLKRSIHIQPDAIRILLTGYTDIDSVIEAINSGEIYKYVTKPWDPVDLTNTVDKAFEKIELRRELKNKNISLEKALTELKTLDQAKSQFMILINHELKTPLTVICSFLELILETPLSDEQKLYLQRIEKSTHKLQSIIERVLLLVSAQTGQIELHIKSLEVLAPLKQIITSKAKDIEQKNLSFNLKGVTEKLKIDEKSFNVIAEELIKNVIQFSSTDSEVVVRTEKLGSGHRFVIENSGPKLSPELIETIIKPFALNENIMNHSSGLGLGLSLSQALLLAHNSCLDIQYTKGQVSVSFKLVK